MTQTGADRAAGTVAGQLPWPPGDEWELAEANRGRRVGSSGADRWRWGVGWE
jgi:hypothetical protein